ncbi:hypothetical protein [Nonomuraea sp. NPDC049784]
MMLVTDAVATALTELGAPGTEYANLSEGSMAQLKPTSDTGGIAAIDSGG